MNFALSDDQVLLRDAAQSFVDKEGDLRKLLVPGATARDAPYEANWRKLCELGWPGLIVPEKLGGSGLDCVELSVIVTELGRSLLPSPFAGHTFGTWALLLAGSPDQREALLPGAAAGSERLALIPPMDGNEIVCRDGRLTGTHPFVVDALNASRLIVAAREPGGEWAFYAVTVSSPEVDVTCQPWKDITRQVCRVTLNGAEAARLPGDFGWCWPALRDRVCLFLAAENAGGIRSVLDAAVGYSNERIAFGRPIGAYQAIKHPLAEMLADQESAATAVLYAAWALETGDERASLAASMAKAFSSDAYLEATHRNIQIFGAIGFTWEMPNHLYYKRARGNARLFGDSRAHRSHVINEATGRLWCTPLACDGDTRVA